MPLFDLTLVALGLFILVGAGDVLVKGAVNLALRLGIPALIVSLTIVAFGTSAPELLVSVQAILEDVPGIALGNVVGSNIANVLLVLGIPAIIAGISCDGHDTRRSYLQMLGGTALFIALAFYTRFVWWSGLILLAGLAFMLFDAYRQSVLHRAEVNSAPAAAAEDLEGVDPDMPWWKIALFLGLGLLGLPLGADLLVDGASDIARVFGVPETVIGLTLVAFGTSLPELAAAAAAAWRGHSDVALGNVIGSNLFNLLGIIGIASFVGPIPVAPEFLSFDLWVMAAASLALIPFVFFKLRINRLWGLAFFSLYCVYVVSLF